MGKIMEGKNNFKSGQKIEFKKIGRLSYKESKALAKKRGIDITELPEKDEFPITWETTILSSYIETPKGKRWLVGFNKLGMPFYHKEEDIRPYSE